MPPPGRSTWSSIRRTVACPPTSPASSGTSAPLVITALGSPARVVEEIHSYGGLVFADVNSVGFARKAAAAGVDGLVLVAAGAGGHTGQTAGFAFVEEVRQFWDGPLVLGGAISTGHAVRAAEILGADLAYLGTSLIACVESMAVPGYKDMVVAAGAEDIVPSKGITGVTANWLKSSLIAAGYDPANMAEDKRPNFSDAQDDAKAWKNVWSAGQGVGAVRGIDPTTGMLRTSAVTVMMRLPPGDPVTIALTVARLSKRSHRRSSRTTIPI